MKKWLQIIVAVLVVIGIGSVLTIKAKDGNDRYRTALADGNQAVESNQYANAVVNYRKALNYEPNRRTTLYKLRQTQAMIAGNDFYQQKRFDLAAAKYQRAVNLDANVQLTKRAKVSFKNAQLLLNNYRTFVWNYDRALHLNQQGHFTDSKQLLNQQLLTNPDASLAPFKMIIDKARQLQNNNEQRKRSNEGMTTIAKVVGNVPAPTESLNSLDQSTDSNTINQTNTSSSSSSMAVSSSDNPLTNSSSSSTDLSQSSSK